MAIVGDIVKEYLDRFPDVRTKTLARKIYNENPAAFLDVEAARMVIRYYRKKGGNKNRRGIASDKYAKPSDFSAWNKIPEGEKGLDWNNPVTIECKRALVISDVHVPYHSKDAIEITLNHALKKGVDCVYINGDFLDAYQLSRWNKDPRKRSFAEELKIGRNILAVIHGAFPGVEKYYKVGNHDQRYELYMQLKAPELLDIPEFSLRNILGLDEMGFKYVDSLELARINGLSVLHGHEIRGWSPINPAKNAFNKALDTILISHNHQSSSHSSKTIKDKFITAFSIGCLSDLRPHYLPVNNHNWGFCYIEKEFDGFNVDNKKIVKGRVRSV